jgi:ferredoxin-type protein NapF
MTVKAQSIRIVSLVAAIIFALPIPLGLFTGFYLWVSPFIFLNSILSTRSLAVFNLFGFIALAAIVWKDRWFCHYLCPAGVLCDAASNIGWNRKALRKIIFLSKPICLAALILAAFSVPLLTLFDPISLFYSFLDGFRSQAPAAQCLKISGLGLVLAMNIAVPHVWCQRFCPLGGLQDLCAGTRMATYKWLHASPRQFNLKRRYLLTGLLGSGLGIWLQRLAPVRFHAILRPPGASPENHFKTTCIRCGNCVRVCPTGVLKPSLDSNDWIGALTPQVLFQDSYCLPECIQCGRVCPSGAISRFSQDGKKRLPIGIARIHQTDCLLTNNRECDRCKTYCAYSAIEIKKSNDDFSSYPFIINNRCVGCGACKIVCPVEAIVIEREEEEKHCL